MSSDRSMIWASRQRLPGRRALAHPREHGRVVRVHRSTCASTWPGPGRPALTHGYLQIASSVARVRFRPAGTPPAPITLGSRRVTTRRVWAFPSKPPIEGPASRIQGALAVVPEGRMPEVVGQCTPRPRRPGRPPAPCRARGPPGRPPGSRVRRVRTKSSEIGPSTCVFSPRRRSAEECRDARGRARTPVRAGRLCGPRAPSARNRPRLYGAARVAAIDTRDRQGKLVRGRVARPVPPHLDTLPPRSAPRPRP